MDYKKKVKITLKDNNNKTLKKEVKRTMRIIYITRKQGYRNNFSC